MYRSAIRSAPRIARSIRPSTLSSAPRRFASTAPADKKRSWKGSALRWGLAAGAIYYYNTSTAFAEEPTSTTVPAPAHFSDEDLPTVDAIVAEKRKEAETRQQKATATPEPATEAAVAVDPSAPAPEVANPDKESAPPPAPGSPEALEAEAGQQGAFNPETGEINWDCPCLGGMADGPCGEQFKAAFSCFVYSTEEPKGMDCIDKFQHMQDCFRLHPEIYGEELADDEEAGAPADEGSTEPGAEPVAPRTATESPSTTPEPAKASEAPVSKSVEPETKFSEEAKADPVHDATPANNQS